MAVSQIGGPGINNLRKFEGLSTDDKPTSNTTGNIDYIIGSGSLFYEVDTGKIFRYSFKNLNPATTNNWWEVI